MSRRNLSGCRVLVTGASSGIGNAIARELAARNSELLITGRRENRLQELTDELRSQQRKCRFVAGDLTVPETRRRLVAAVYENWSGLDALVNCAGIGAMGRFDEASPERLRQIFEVNFFAAAELIRVSAPLLKKGRAPIIVNISSVLGHRAVPFKSEYCASKFALHGFSDSIRGEFKQDGIDVLLVSPSTTDSEFFDSAIEDKLKRNWKGSRPMPTERVARITAQAMRLGKKEVILSAGGLALVWLDRLAPSFADYLIAKAAK